MRLSAFLGCTYAAETKDGSIVLAGVGANKFAGRAFPMALAMKFFLRIEAEEIDVPGAAHRVTLAIVGEDKKLGDCHTPFSMPAGITSTNILTEANGAIPTPGRYRVDALVDGEIKGSWPVEFIKA